MKTRLLPIPRRRPQGSPPPVFRSAKPPVEVASPALPGMGVASIAPPVFNPMLSVGHQLMQARKDRSLTIEDAAFETRIPHQRLSEMENDDLSNFANLTYAKGFLKLYSRYLHLDLSDYLDEFDTSAVAEATGHEYAMMVGSRSAPARLAPPIAMDNGRGRAGWLGATALVAVIGIAVFVIFKTRDQPAGDNPAPGSGTASATSAAALPPPGGPDTSLARAERSVTPKAPPVSVESEEADPDSTRPADPDSRVRRATLVDENGNEVPLTVRPPRS